MKYKVGYEELKGFSNPIKTAERYSNWFRWMVAAVCALTITWLWVKIYQLYLIHLWVSSI